VKLWLKSGILAVALLAFGAARLSFEDKLGAELRAAGLMPPRLQLGTRDKIGQTSSAVALGGLRTLVATFLNLRAYTAFTEQRWEDIEEIFNTIVDLAPRTRYYWETGSWHLGYNAAAYYQNDRNLPPLRRREAWKLYVTKGRAFLERGMLNIPDDWSLAAGLGALLSDPNKFAAFRDPNATFAAAAEAYRKSAATGNALDYVKRFRVYALARVEGREHEALVLIRALYAEGRQNHTPTLLMVLLVLEAHDDPSMDVAQRAIELFGSPAKAYSALCNHWQRTREHFPVFGVSAALEALEKTLEVPKEQSILRKNLPPPPNPDDWFRN
jgi:hypothetical protein